MNSPTQTQDPISAALAAEAFAVVCQLAMLDARDLANRAVSHANALRQLGDRTALAAAEIFDRKAAELRDLERTYAALAGLSSD